MVIDKGNEIDIIIEKLQELKKNGQKFDSIRYVPSETRHTISAYDNIMVLVIEHEDSIVLKYTTTKKRYPGENE